ncbi:MAG: hypothetical protein EAY72_14065 [Bacteroidetes bacterium]|nr:MAG: hypothetical protein EAY72_14065 [Bacteroidota bacterium]TAE62221.1 MAG: hypothetical protein EAY68_08930 [Bacteroidota bacterium]
MKTILTAFLSLLLINAIKAQTVRCGSELNLPLIQQTNPMRYQRIMELEEHTRRYVTTINNSTQNSRLVNPNSIIVIPVVVHVLHRGEAIGTGRNISLAQIQSQINILNEDFRRLNADRINTPIAFQTVAGDANLEFRLACVDPTGNITNGVTRTLAGIERFTFVSGNNGTDEVATRIKFTDRGGRDAWPTDRYLNIWVCDLTGGTLGYAQFPDEYTTKPTTDGIVCHSYAFGNQGLVNQQQNNPFWLNGSNPFNLGRTATHEIGHWLNLRHIWGDANCGNDFVDDTPTQQRPTANGGCPTFPSISCNNNPNGNMFMNYMDYSDDACMNICTQGQSQRMRAVFAQGGPRAHFINNYFRISNTVNPICGTEATLTVSNPSCLPVTWSIVSGQASIINGQGTNTVSILRTGTGTATIRATAGGYVDEIQVTLGEPLPVTQLNVFQQICGSGVQWWLDPNVWQPNTIYNWTFTNVQSGMLITSGTTAGSSMYAWLYGDANSSWNITVTPQNNCGTGTTYSTVWGNPCPDGNCCQIARISASPNPAKDEMIVTIDNSKQLETKARNTSIQLELIDVSSGQAVKRWKLPANQQQYRLNVADIKKGQYVLSIINGKHREGKHIVIEK